MQYNVAQLLKEPVGAVRRYQLTENLEELDPDLHLLGPLVGNLLLLRTNSGVLATGELSTAAQVKCGRCIEPIVMPLRIVLEESFRPLTEVETGRFLRRDEFEGDLNDYEDEALLIDVHHILDLSEVVRQNLWLAMPMYPTCNWNGPGECPNLIAQKEALAAQMKDEDDDTTIGASSVDPRWSALLKLREQMNDEGYSAVGQDL